MPAVLWAGGGLAAQDLDRNSTARFTDRLVQGGQFMSASFEPRVTPSGDFVVISTAQDILMIGTPAGVRQIYRIPRLGGEAILVSRIAVGSMMGNPAQSSCFRPSISNDGNRIVYDTLADMLNGLDMGGDTNGRPDVYMRDLITNVTTRISERFDVEPNGNSNFAWISGNGAFVAFTSTSSNIATDALGNPITDANAIEPDVFRWSIDPMGLESIQIASVNNKTPPAQSFFDFTFFTTGSLRVGRVISDNGRFVVFSGAPCDWDSGSQDCGVFPGAVNCLCPQPDLDCAACLSGENSEIHQVYLRDFGDPMAVPPVPPRTFRVSRRGNPFTFTAGNNDSRDPVINSTGTTIAFSTFATNLPGDADVQEDVFYFDFGNAMNLNNTGANPLRISVPMGGPSNGQSTRPMLSPGGTQVVFQSSAANLISGDTNARIDVFLARVQPGVVSLIRASVGMSETIINQLQANINSGDPDIGLFSVGGLPGQVAAAVVYASTATNLVDGDTNGLQDVFETRNRGFRRGDADGNGVYNEAIDGQFLGNFLFAGGMAPSCMDAADFNNDGIVNITDVGTESPAPPGDCTADPTTPPPIDQIACRSYSPCGI
jgi:hypothetical protein